MELDQLSFRALAEKRIYNQLVFFGTYLLRASRLALRRR
jgi:hypothetical protein